MKVNELHAVVVGVDTRLKAVETEVSTNRKFKHDTNGTLQAHTGKIEVIVTQQNHTAEAIERLTAIVADGMFRFDNGMKEIAKIVNIKYMIIGAAAGCSALVAGSFFLLKTYLDYYK